MHPIVFRVGPFAVRFYGLMYVTALLVGIWLLRLEAKRRGLLPDLYAWHTKIWILSIHVS